MLEKGRGVAQDYAEAARWFGLPEACMDFTGHPDARRAADSQRCAIAAQAVVL